MPLCFLNQLIHNFPKFLLSAQVKLANANTRTDVAKALDQTAVFMGIANRDQSPVFDPATQTAYLNFFNPDPALFDGTKAAMLNGLGRLSDVIEIKTTSAINLPPLKVSNHKPKPGDILYLIGFPSETTDRSKMGVQDSDGQNMFITIGKVMTTQDWIQRTQNNLSPIVESLFNDYMILADFDCEHGNSGGPIVNGDGEVVGIMAGMWMDQTKSPNTRICGGLGTLDKNKLSDVWQKLAN